MNRPLLPCSLLALLLSVAACDGPSPQASNAPVAEGQPAPPLTGVALDGQAIDLAALSGKIVVVDFWASWCEPCEEAMPGLEALAADHGDRLVVIGVSVDEDPAAMRAFVERVGVDFAIIHDADHSIADRWAPPKMPTTFVVAPDGSLAAIHDGYEGTTAARLRADIEALSR